LSLRRNPQLGRFLGVDPLAANGGQDMFSPYAAMGNAPESMVDPNGTSPGFGNELFANNPVENSFAGSEGTSGSGASGGFGSGGDQNLGTGGQATAGGGWDYGANGSAANKISNDNAEKTDDMNGYDPTQGTSGTPSNLDDEKKSPTGPFNETEEHGDIPETSAWI
jgi:hypothetical protein